jgi:hypothetical protein
MAKRIDKARIQDVKFREMPDITIKVVCRYRAELFFKISRKTKLSRLFDAWTERMECQAGGKGTLGQMNGSARWDAASTQGPTPTSSTMQFVFTHNGRAAEADQTPEDAGMEDGDEILAVELMDLTEGPALDEFVRPGDLLQPVILGTDHEYCNLQEELTEPRRQKLKKTWNDDPQE